jgi:hypothetical protein
VPNVRQLKLAIMNALQIVELNVQLDAHLKRNGILAEISTSEIAEYFEKYSDYLIENGLDNDSKTITVADLIYFVDNIIGE